MGTQSAQPAHGCGDAPVDLIHLSRQTLGNRSLEREVLSLFATQSTNCIGRLEVVDSFDEHKMLIHTLKGSAQGIGAWHIVDAAGFIEDADRASSDLCRDDAAQDRMAVLMREVAVANAYICTLLNDG